MLQISTLKRERSHEGGWHHHQQGQLFVISKGLLVLQTESGRSVMPSQRAGWIPPLHQHKAKSFGPISGEIFYLAPSLCLDLPQQPCVFTPNGLLVEIMVRMASWQKQKHWKPAQMNLLQVMVDELKVLKPDPLYLPLPEEKRLEKMAHAFILNPGISKTQEEWAKNIHLTKRTFTRHFRQQTGMSFAKWCQQVRIMHALEYLAQGKSVTWIAMTLGYNSVSAFIKVFCQMMGVTPSNYSY
jgi:AraC-like DNA-binding protein